LSARFPWITPAGWIDAYPIVGGDQNSDGSTVASNNGRTPGSSKLQLQLVDDGYADNLGILTGLDLISDINKEADGSFELYLIPIHVNQSQRESTLTNDYFTPIAALLSVRDEQGAVVLERAKALLNPTSSPASADPNSEAIPSKFLELVHQDNSYKLPLGWELADLTSSVIARSIGVPNQCDPDASSQAPADTVIRSNCTLARIIQIAVPAMKIPSVQSEKLIPTPLPPPSTTLRRPALFDCLHQATYLFPIVKQSQIDGINAILDAWEGQSRTNDMRQLAYILATVYHETAQSFIPGSEYGGPASGRYIDPENGVNYYGRGYLQIVYVDNYKKVSELVGTDVFRNPNLLLDPKISAKATVLSMLDGVFTGKKLGDYFTSEDADWINARRVVNGLDKAAVIAKYAWQINNCLSNSRN